MFLLTKPKPAIEDWPVASKLTGWMKRIQEAEERGKFSQDDYRASGDWGTCAVGECFGSDHWYHDNFFNSPLNRAGVGFTLAVVGDNIPHARELFLQIKALADAR